MITSLLSEWDSRSGEINNVGEINNLGDRSVKETFDTVTSHNNLWCVGQLGLVDMLNMSCLPRHIRTVHPLPPEV